MVSGIRKKRKKEKSKRKQREKNRDSQGINKLDQLISAKRTKRKMPDCSIAMGINMSWEA